MDENSYFIVESMGSYKDTPKEHEQSFGVDDNTPNMHPCVIKEYDEQ